MSITWPHMLLTLYSISLVPVKFSAWGGLCLELARLSLTAPAGLIVLAGSQRWTCQRSPAAAIITWPTHVSPYLQMTRYFCDRRGNQTKERKKTVPRVNTAAWIRDESGDCRESCQTFDISFLLKYPRLGMTGVKRARQTNLSGVKLMRDLITIDLGPVWISE